eukprot:5123088-Pleurochrysis_carterae.AAC.1
MTSIKRKGTGVAERGVDGVGCGVVGERTTETELWSREGAVNREAKLRKGLNRRLRSAAPVAKRLAGKGVCKEGAVWALQRAGKRCPAANFIGRVCMKLLWRDARPKSVVSFSPRSLK